MLCPTNALCAFLGAARDHCLHGDDGSGLPRLGRPVLAEGQPGDPGDGGGDHGAVHDRGRDEDPGGRPRHGEHESGIWLAVKRRCISAFSSVFAYFWCTNANLHYTSALGTAHCSSGCFG